MRDVPTAEMMAGSAGAGRRQRVDGAAHLAFGPRGLVDLYQRAPCRVLFPDVEPGEPIQAVMLTTSGGLTGGDRVSVTVDVGEGAGATLTTQAAEKLYRALPDDGETLIETRLAVAAGAWAEWLGQEAIVFDGACVRRSFEADVAPTGRLLAVESLVFGRTAMGETFATGRIHDAWRIRRDGRLVWVDVLRLEAQAADEPFGLGQARAQATMLYVGADAADHLQEARRLLGNDRGGATAFDGLLIVRLLDVDTARLRRAVARLIAGLRAAIAGLAPRLPAVWTC